MATKAGGQEVLWCRRCSYLVSLVVVLWVVLEDLRPFLVVKGADQLFDPNARILIAPLLTLLEPIASSATQPPGIEWLAPHA